MMNTIRACTLVFTLLVDGKALLCSFLAAPSFVELIGAKQKVARLY
jgi:hypothetical protein